MAARSGMVGDSGDAQNRELIGPHGDKTGGGESNSDPHCDPGMLGAGVGCGGRGAASGAAVRGGDTHISC